MSEQHHSHHNIHTATTASGEGLFSSGSIHQLSATPGSDRQQQQQQQPQHQQHQQQQQPQRQRGIVDPGSPPTAPLGGGRSDLGGAPSYAQEKTPQQQQQQQRRWESPPPTATRMQAQGGGHLPGKVLGQLSRYESVFEDVVGWGWSTVASTASYVRQMATWVVRPVARVSQYYGGWALDAARVYWYHWPMLRLFVYVFAAIIAIPGSIFATYVAGTMGFCLAIATLGVLTVEGMFIAGAMLVFGPTLLISMLGAAIVTGGYFVLTGSLSAAERVAEQGTVGGAVAAAVSPSSTQPRSQAQRAFQDTAADIKSAQYRSGSGSEMLQSPSLVSQPIR
ncbi:hypothetical protein BC828DRAFT_373822 [Blastocladiella britannica]|nr:hypothetical protein BC828DRAFT_373822 [Blastocladiella britannica]